MDTRRQGKGGEADGRGKEKRSTVDVIENHRDDRHRNEAHTATEWDSVDPRQDTHHIDTWQCDEELLRERWTRKTARRVSEKADRVDHHNADNN